MTTYFFLGGSTLLLVAALALLRDRRPALRPFGIAGSLTALVLLAGAVLRLFDPASAGDGPRRLLEGITVANLSATTVLLVVWTLRLPPRT
ncbi:MAG: hypothetical protein R3325_00870 [Thermoanaerobaculia bacterium]|nr:hypothetical protein [Thermoanaerobaculia bacterium]